MADRYQDRPPPADDYDRGDDRHGSARAESDPLAELARLIGQTDPFAVTSMPRANLKAQPRAAAPEPDPYRSAAETYDEPPPGPPSWLQRANRQADPPAPEPEPDYSRSVHPLHRYAAQQAAPAQDVQQDHQPQDYREEPAYPETDEQLDPSRYDEALYGQIESGAQDYQREPAYPDDPYAYPEDAYDGEPEQKRRGMMAVAAILALAVVGTGAALAYRTYMGSPRSNEPPIIKADNTPTKIVPAPADGSAKVPDRMAATDGTEKIVPREEAPVDVNAKVGGPRVVFPPLNPNANPPTPASVAPSNMPVATSSQGSSNGTLPNSEPRRIKTLSVPGDQQDSAAVPAVPPPAAKPAPAKTTAASAPRNPSQANASANAPLSLAPQPRSAPAEAPTRVAATNPAQVAPPAVGGGGYMVQVSAQRNEADAQASYRAMQSKFPAVLGSHTPVIKRADLGDKGVFYRAMVGPFGTADEAAQFCGNLKNAGGQCVIHRN